MPDEIPDVVLGEMPHLTDLLFTFYSSARISKFTDPEALILTAKFMEITLNRTNQS